MDWGDPADCGMFALHIQNTGADEKDYKIYEKVVEATHKLKPIFYDSNE